MHCNCLTRLLIGAGKSTVIKLLIDVLAGDESEHAAPVVGPPTSDIPTSGDVHLYMDPQTAASPTPILFADCEGLDGGEREPLSAKLRRNKVVSGGSGSQAMPFSIPLSERELTWATTSAKRTRAYAVSHMYPQLLYTFSDIIVFVLKNPKYVL